MSGGRLMGSLVSGLGTDTGAGVGLPGFLNLNGDSCFGGRVLGGPCIEVVGGFSVAGLRNE